MGVEILINGCEQARSSLGKSKHLFEERQELRIGWFEEEGHDWREGRSRHSGVVARSHGGSKSIGKPPLPVFLLAVTRIIHGILAVMAKRDEDQFSELKEALVSLGPVRRGTVLRRFMPCGKPGCRCQADPPKLHGPYYEWTRKVSGKTVSVRLSEQQAGLLGQWIANARHLDQIVAEIERVSLRLTEPLLQGAAKPRKA